jgi:DNA-directed RNA polymerase subunit RPC12/RpoP
MKKMRFAFLAAILLGLVTFFTALAQTEQLTLRMSRDWGYGGFNGDIQGLFSMKVTGPADLERVVFYIDDTAIGEIKQPPFNLQFTTDNYPSGQHELHAVGYSMSGQEYCSKSITANFVPASESSKAAMRIVLPVLGVVFGAMLLAVLVPLLMGRKTVNLVPGAPRTYPLGGGVCPKCNRPFAIHFWGLNLYNSKYDRCPYCGKWSVVKFASLDKLRAAEQAELEGEMAQVPEMTEEEKLKKDLENSKYQGS